MSGWLFAYLYLTGFLNGVWIVAMEAEATGCFVPLYKMVLATVLWPLLVPACLAVVAVRRLAR